MDYFTLQHIGLFFGFMLILIGIWGILTQKNIIKIIIGFTVMNTGINVVIVSLAYVKDRTAPIIDSALDGKVIAESIVDPVPQALVLTAIVIGLGVTALMLTYAVKLYQQRQSLDITSFKDLKL